MSTFLQSGVLGTAVLYGVNVSNLLSNTTNPNPDPAISPVLLLPVTARLLLPLLVRVRVQDRRLEQEQTGGDTDSRRGLVSLCQGNGLVKSGIMKRKTVHFIYLFFELHWFLHHVNDSLPFITCYWITAKCCSITPPNETHSTAVQFLASSRHIVVFRVGHAELFIQNAVFHPNNNVHYITSGSNLLRCRSALCWVPTDNPT